jgi:hypothetical protein
VVRVESRGCGHAKKGGESRTVSLREINEFSSRGKARDIRMQSMRARLGGWSALDLTLLFYLPKANINIAITLKVVIGHALTVTVPAPVPPEARLL